MRYLFYGVIINHTLSTSCNFNISRNPFSWTRDLVNVKLESGGEQDMAGLNPALDFNELENYAIRDLRPPNVETSKPEIKIIADKYRDKDKFYP